MAHEIDDYVNELFKEHFPHFSKLPKWVNKGKFRREWITKVKRSMMNSMWQDVHSFFRVKRKEKTYCHAIDTLFMIPAWLIVPIHSDKFDPYNTFSINDRHVAHYCPRIILQKYYTFWINELHDICDELCYKDLSMLIKSFI